MTAVWRFETSAGGTDVVVETSYRSPFPGYRHLQTLMFRFGMGPRVETALEQHHEYLSPVT